jgi:2-oxoglutarate dehydrogenase E2 component (dihydrolipoamide succinyltransferase)
MSDINVYLPKLGESILSATVVKWFKHEGDEIEMDEPLLEVTTDKLNSEIPSPVKGVIKEILVKNNQELRVGEILAVISTQEVAQVFKEEKKLAPKIKAESNQDFLSPAAKAVAKEHNLSENELMNITRTGAGGRLSKRDIEEHLAKRGSATEQIKMSSMRKAIAKTISKTAEEIPTASLVTEIDVTAVLKLIKKEKEDFLKKHGYKLTITSFLIKAITEGIRFYPHINSTLENDNIIIKKFVNLGLAVNIEDGLVVPVIKNCEAKSIIEIAKNVAILGEKARANKLSPNDMSEGSITMSNFGMGGALIGIPIIKHPEVAIIGVGAINKRVVAIDDDTFGVRDIMMVSLTFDHRIIDGMYGCGFIQEVKNYLEKKASSEL